MLILSHLQAATGAVCVETKEEARCLREILAELPPGCEVCTLAAPSGALKSARTGKAPGKAPVGGLAAGYEWAAGAPGRVLVVYDFQVLVNNPGHWRMLIDALPGLRQSGANGTTESGIGASLVVFIGSPFELSAQNQLKGAIPVIQFTPPDRAAIRRAAETLAPLPDGVIGEAIIDAACGLTEAAAEQALAECLCRMGGQYDPAVISGSRKQILREAGLEVWETVPELGGLGPVKAAIENEIIPWVRHPKLAVRRILAAGVPGVGKSYFGRYLAGRMNCLIVRLSMPRLKRGIVGASEGALMQVLSVLDTLGHDSPIVVVIDEIDSIARDGLDGGVSSGMFAEMLTWLNDSRSQCVVVATLNHLDKLDAALDSRFSLKFFFDLPTSAEREAIAAIHYRDLGATDGVQEAASRTAFHTDGFSARDLQLTLCPTVMRESNLAPTDEVIKRVAAGMTPTSKTHAVQLGEMRHAAGKLRRANDSDDIQIPRSGRKLAQN